MSALTDKFPGYLTTGIAVSVVLFVLLLFGIIALYSLDAIIENGWSMFSWNWHPATEQYGIFPMLYGTALVTTIALLLAVPTGILIALYIFEIAHGSIRYYIKACLELLAGIPSVLYGLLGVTVLSVWFDNLFDLQSGRIFLTGGVLLALMVLPTIVSLTDDAIQNVPQSYHEAARALGLYRYQVLFKVVLPLSWPDIVSAILLAFGRVVGETIAVMLVIGSIDRFPDRLFSVLEPGQTITSKLGREIAESAFGSLHFSSLILLSLILMLVVMSVSILSVNFYNPIRRLHE